jgi:hypothetical protein
MDNKPKPHVAELVPKIEGLIREWLGFIEHSEPASEDDLMKLEELTDRLALLRHELGPIHQLGLDDGEDIEEATIPGYYQLCAKRFPMLGWYNIPAQVCSFVAENHIHFGDAIDDIADITRDLLKVIRLIDHSKYANACWDLAFHYDHHCRYHLRGLQWYLEHRRFEGVTD